MVHSPSLQHKLPNERVHLHTSSSSDTKSFMVQSEAVCRANGARLTPIRRRVLEALNAAERPLGAYDLVEVLALQGRRLSPITVYRALDFLIEQGLAYRIASRNAYVANSSSRETTAFLICEECGDANEVASPEVADTVLKVLKAKGYQPRVRILEITGRCAACQDVH